MFWTQEDKETSHLLKPLRHSRQEACRPAFASDCRTHQSSHRRTPKQLNHAHFAVKPTTSKHGLLISILILALLVALTSGPGAPPPLPSQEQEVVEALLREEIQANGSSEQVVRDVASMAHLVFTNGYDKFLQILEREGQRRNPAYKEALADMVKKNQTEATISTPTHIKKPVHLVSEATLKRILPFQSDPRTNNWDPFYATFKSSREVVTVSRPGVDSKGNIAVVCFGVQNRWVPGFCQVSVLKREGKEWFLELYRRSLGGPLREGMATVIFKLRYYLSGSQSETNRVRVIQNYRTNLVCWVDEPGRLFQTTNGLSPWDVSGFVFQIVEPPEYAGQVFSAHFDGPLASGDPFMGFSFGKRYQINLAKERLGNLDFSLCY
jgi:hypothetical protein